MSIEMKNLLCNVPISCILFYLFFLLKFDVLLRNNQHVLKNIGSSLRQRPKSATVLWVKFILNIYTIYTRNSTYPHGI